LFYLTPVSPCLRRSGYAQAGLSFKGEGDGIIKRGLPPS
jgi:hypothetical protein